MRIKLENVKAISTKTKIIKLAENQCFYSMPKAYEVWQEKPLFRVIRIPKDRILLVFEK